MKMKIAVSMILLLMLTLGGFWLNWPHSTTPSNELKAQLLSTYGKLPLSFEQNQGQVNKVVHYLSRGPGYTLFLTDKEAVLILKNPTTNKKTPRATDLTKTSLKESVVRLTWLNANAHPKISASELFPGKSNYFIGHDSKKWKTNIPLSGKVNYREVYPGIDLVFYGNKRQLEHDFVVAPGSDPTIIRLQLSGVKNLQLDKLGNLVTKLNDQQSLQFHKPLVYQQINGKKKIIEGRYALYDKNQFGFTVGEYDKSKPLVIDPVLVYSTFLGGNDADALLDIAIDKSGNAYVTGFTSSDDFPTVNQIPGARGSSLDAVISKLNNSGSALVYSSYLGGSGFDSSNGIEVDSDGNAYVAGQTGSVDFPTTANAFQTTNAGNSDGFVAKLNSTGTSLVYATYLGGNSGDLASSIAVDDNGNAFITGFTGSTNFPTQNPLQANINGFIDAFITKLNTTGTALVYSTYLGGSDIDVAGDITVDNGNAYVMGDTTSTDFPIVNAAQGNNAGNADVFISKLNATGSALDYSTYLGGNLDDRGTGIAVDRGNAYTTGSTRSTNFPTTSGVFQDSLAGGDDSFVTKLSSAGSIAYSTYLGGSSDDSGSRIAVDTSGHAFVTGGTSSSDFPTVQALQNTLQGEFDGFVTELNQTGSFLLYSTYLGGTDTDVGVGIAVDESGNAYVAGFTSSPDFPTLNPIQAAYGGGFDDGFVTKIANVISVTIDIKPGSSSNTINLKTEKTVPVAIFSTASFDATTLNPATLRLAGDSRAPTTGASVKRIGGGKFSCSVKDVALNGVLDGIPDLVCQFQVSPSTFLISDTSATLTGSTSDGQAIIGTDSVRIIK